MTNEDFREHVAEMNPEALFADGFEDAIIRTATQFTNVMVCYDREKCIQILMERDKMSYDDAEEFFEFNTAGAYVGASTPCFLTKKESVA